MSEEKSQHLEFTQNVITRMNSNSFQIKSWNITLVSAIFAIYATNQNPYFVLVAVFPTIMFWFLDAYYLGQERKFRGLYNDIAGVPNIADGVTLKVKEIKTYEMRPDLYDEAKYSYWRAFFSGTVAGSYGPMAAIILVIFFILKCK